KSIVDMIFESGSTLCFLEMKVHASEGHRQLNRYSEILLDYSKNKGKTVYLRYCTLYHDEKNILFDDVEFQQFRWAKIAKFLENQINNNQLINEFYQFLKENKMAGNERFNYEDLIGLKTLNGVFEKVNGVFHEIKKPLEEKFGNSGGGITNTGQILNHGRLSIYCLNVIGSGPSEVLVAFILSGSKVGEGPVVSVQLWLGDQNESYDKFKSIFQHDEKGIFDAFKTKCVSIKDKPGIGLFFEKPLAEYLEVENQFSSITEWIIQCLNDIDDFKKKYPDIGWNK
ncbi:MAG: hypothetical protein WD607_01050, partial [Candidatus Paceibacterota bacterium]